MIKRTVKIGSGNILHVRSVAMLVQIANQYSCEIFLQDEKHKFNAKSIMGVMTLCTMECKEIEVTANGHDAEKAAAHIAEFLESAK